MITEIERYADYQATINRATRSNQAGIWTALPAIIVKISDMAGQLTVDVQPTIQGTVYTPAGVGSYVQLPICPDLPVVFPRGGGFILTFPLAIGDEVLAVFASRCIDGWFQQGGVQPPFEQRMHDLSDGFAIPGPCSKPNVPSGYSSTTAQLRSVDGSVGVTLDHTGGVVTVAAPTAINLNAPTINVAGAVVATGAISSQSTITAGAGGADQVTMQNHRHTGNNIPPTAGY